MTAPKKDQKKLTQQELKEIMETIRRQGDPRRAYQDGRNPADYSLVPTVTTAPEWAEYNRAKKIVAMIQSIDQALIMLGYDHMGPEAFQAVECLSEAQWQIAENFAKVLPCSAVTRGMILSIYADRADISWPQSAPCISDLHDAQLA